MMNPGLELGWWGRVREDGDHLYFVSPADGEVSLGLTS